MRRIALPALLALSLAACAGDPNDTLRQNRGTAMGAGAGAVVGGVVGAILDKKDRRGVPVGAAAGAAVGAGIGSLFDRQQRAFEDTLSQERAANEIQVERVQDNLLKLTLDSEVSFDFDSATLRPEFRDSVQKLSSVLNKYTDTNARIVGHTDSRGSDAYNQTLSERRAVAVQQALVMDGVAPQRLSTQGLGESQPRATNDTEAGRQLNRRVEIFVSPANQPTPVS